DNITAAVFYRKPRVPRKPLKTGRTQHSKLAQGFDHCRWSRPEIITVFDLESETQALRELCHRQHSQCVNTLRANLWDQSSGRSANDFRVEPIFCAADKLRMIKHRADDSFAGAACRIIQIGRWHQ